MYLVLGPDWLPAVRDLHSELSRTDIRHVVIEASFNLQKSWNIEDDDKNGHWNDIERGADRGCPMPSNKNTSD